MNYLSHIIGIWILFTASKVYGADESWCGQYKVSFCKYRDFVKLCTKHCEGHIIEPKWNPWTTWSTCSKDCGGIQTRTRDCNFDGASSINDCPLADGKFAKYETDTRNCNGIGASCHVAVNGNWADWGAWSECDVTCGKGKMVRSRKCTDPAPEHGGLACKSLDGTKHLTTEEESTDCSRIDCPVDGGYTLWTPWTACSATCGDGRKYQTRCCTNPIPKNNGKDCEGPGLKSEPCSPINCPVDGNWGKWSAFGDCDKTCGFTGTKHRFRECNNPAPKYNGKTCEGVGKETAVCGRIPCPVDGVFSEWAPWSQCSDNCNGVQYRTRCCNSPAPLHNGRPCDPKTGELRPCKARATQCPIVPGVEKLLVDTKKNLPTNEEVDVIALMDKEYTVQFTVSLTGVPTAGNIISFHHDSNKILQVELVRSTIENDLKISTVVNGTLGSWTSSISLQEDGTEYKVKIRQFLDVGELKREILIDDDRLDITFNDSPKVYRDVKVILGETTGAGNVDIQKFKFYNNPTKVCPGKADVLYIIDSSISVQANFKKEITFTSELARAFPVGVDNLNRGAAITFSADAEVAIKFAEPTTNIMFRDSLEQIQFDNTQVSSTRIDLALYKAKETIFSVTNGDRVDVPNLAILIVEGDDKTPASTPGHASPDKIAQEMRDNGIEVFAVGIHQDQNSITEEKLKSIAGENKYILAQSWDELANEEFIGRSLDIACRVLTNEKEIKFPSQ